MIHSIDKSDSSLIRAYKSGDEASFEILLNRHKDKLFGFIISKVKDYELANDLFQETFIKVINTLKTGSYNEEGKFLPWVMRIAHNLIIDYFRKRKKMNMISESFSQSNNFSIFQKISNGEKDYVQKVGMIELEKQMVKLVDLLSENQKTIVYKRLFQGMSFKDISEEEGISINTALGRMRYAMINIRKIIDSKGIEVNV